MIFQISALKQNGLLQTLAAGGDQPNPAGNALILSHDLSVVSQPLPSGIRECILDTRQPLQVKPPSGVQIACLEKAKGLAGTLIDAGLVDGWDLLLRTNAVSAFAL